MGFTRDLPVISIFGLASAACLVTEGHRVISVGIDARTPALLRLASARVADATRAAAGRRRTSRGDAPPAGVQPVGCSLGRTRARMDPSAVDSCAKGSAVASERDMALTGRGQGMARRGSS